MYINDPIYNAHNPVIVVSIGDGALLTKSGVGQQLVMDIAVDGDIERVHRSQIESLALIYDYAVESLAYR